MVTLKEIIESPEKRNIANIIADLTNICKSFKSILYRIGPRQIVFLYAINIIEFCTS